MRIRHTGGRGKRSPAGPRPAPAPQALAAGAGPQPPLAGGGETTFGPWLRDDDTYLAPATRRARRGPLRSRSSATQEDARASERGAALARFEEQRRAATVEALRVRVASGDYTVDSTALARRLLGLEG